MYITVREYRGEAPEVVAEAKKREESLRGVIRAIRGFVDYYLIDLGKGGLATVSIFEDQAGAEESVRVAAAWVRENLAQWAPNPPTVLTGEVAIHIGK